MKVDGDSPVTEHYPTVNINRHGLPELATSPKGELSSAGESRENSAESQRIQELEAELKSQTVKADLWNAEVLCSFLRFISKCRGSTSFCNTFRNC